jgi:peptidoglycan/xylan/chitin deacetylase (PgdA/CDA1 family)
MASLPKSLQPSLSRPPLTPSELLEAAAVSRSRNFRLAQQRINYNTFSGGTPYQKLVALTFDDGPDPLQTPRVLQILRQHKVTATFFVIGSKVDENPELTQQLAAEGHDLGNHTYHHYNMSTFNEEGVRFQVERTSQSIEKAVGGPTRWFRAPGCRYTPEVLKVLRDLDMVRVDTTNNTGDWAKRDPASVVRAVMNRLKPGDVILCHDRLPLTTKALPALIRAVRARGYRFVSLAELAQRAQASNFTPVSWPVNQGVVLDDPRRRAIRIRSKRKVRFSLASMENPGVTITADAAGSRDSVQVKSARRRAATRKVRRRIQRDRETRRLSPARAPRPAPTVQRPLPAKPLIPRTVVVPAPARVRPVLPAPVGRVPSSILTGLAEG